MAKTIDAVKTAKKGRTSTKVKAQQSCRRFIDGYAPNACGYLLAIRDILIEIHEKVCEG